MTADETSPGEPPAFATVPDARPDDRPWPLVEWPPATWPVLSGHFVTCTPLDPQEDATELFASLDHDAVWEHVAGRPTDPESYARSLEGALASGRAVFVVRLARELAGLPAGARVGTTSYLEISAHDARLEIGATAYTPALWATAVNPETKLLLLDHAFGALGVGRVQLKTDVRNLRSQRAIARLGARYEGTLRRYQRRSDGTVRDTVLFSILAEEWPEVRGRLVARRDLAVQEHARR